MSSLSIHEPAPIPNSNPAVWDLVIEDMRERDRFGAEKYHTHLQPFNGRDVLIDAYQEALDLVVYLRQKIYEDEGLVQICIVNDGDGHDYIIPIERREEFYNALAICEQSYNYDAFENDFEQFRCGGVDCVALYAQKSEVFSDSTTE